MVACRRRACIMKSFQLGTMLYLFRGYCLIFFTGRACHHLATTVTMQLPTKTDNLKFPVYSFFFLSSLHLGPFTCSGMLPSLSAQQILVLEGQPTPSFNFFLDTILSLPCQDKMFSLPEVLTLGGIIIIVSLQFYVLHWTVNRSLSFQGAQFPANYERIFMISYVGWKNKFSIMLYFYVLMKRFAIKFYQRKESSKYTFRGIVLFCGTLNMPLQRTRTNKLLTFFLI